MKLFTQKLSILFFLITPGLLFSQVSFTNQGNLLGTAAGSTYQDCGVDMNGDYLDDVVRVSDNGIYIDYQQTDGSFVQTFFPMAIQNPPNWSICAGDIDKNGFNDLLFGNGERVSFCYANDDGTAYTEDPHPEYIFSQRSTFADIDNDGNLDAFVNHDVDQSHPYRNDGSGNMVLDQTLIETLDVGGNYAAIWVDYDNDWDTDLYITKCRGGAPFGDARRINLLYRNNGDGTFTSVGPEANMDDGNQSWTTVFEDFDNDGDFDAFTVNHSYDDIPGGAANRYMRNNGDGTFTDIIDETGIDKFDLDAWDCDAGDFNNDGFIDIFSQMSTELYLNNGDGTFTAQELPFNMGGIGDYNNDGYLDVIQDDNLWINNGSGNNWIEVGCNGLISNKNGIGARLELYGEWGMQIREIRAGESFRPMSSLVEHFGIGSATEITQLIVRWPSGTISTIDNPAINSKIIVSEYECILPPTEVTLVGSPELCPGATVEMIADEGTSYLWSNGDTTQNIMVSEPGTFSVIIFGDDACASESNEVEVTNLVEEQPVISVFGEVLFCEGGSVELISSDASSYIWSNGEEGQSITVDESGEYTVAYNSICTGDLLVSESIAVNVFPAAGLPVVESIEIAAPGTAILTASGENLLWYDDEFSTDIVGEGPTFETEFFESQISYWVEANAIYGGEEMDGGKPDNFGGGGISNIEGSLIFDVYEPITLKEVTIYVLDQDNSGPGNRTFTLYNFDGDIVATHTEFFEVGTHVVELDFNISEGTGYRLGCNEHNLFRNNTLVTFPYLLGLEGEAAGKIINSDHGSLFYYYFYDWKVETQNFACASERIEATATVTAIDELSLVNEFKLYPNPAHDATSILFTMKKSSIIDIYVFDVVGNTVYANLQQQISEGSNKLDIDLNGWAAGIYQLKFIIEGQSKSTKFIVE